MCAEKPRRAARLDGREVFAEKETVGSAIVAEASAANSCTDRARGRGLAAVSGSLPPPLRDGIVGLFFWMPQWWQTQRREEMRATLPDALVRTVTCEGEP